jgi:hypothetical protein
MFSESLVDFKRATWPYIPEDGTLYNYWLSYLDMELRFSLLRDDIFGVFENVPRIFGANTETVTEERRKLHNEEMHNLYSSRN